MVRFGTFKVRNAHPFKSIDLDLIKKGLVRIVGRNGAGKSSLWHLMTFLYYGINPTKATKSEIAMDTKDFLLEGSFEKQGVWYLCANAIKSKEKNPLGDPYGTGFFLFKKSAEGIWENISWHKAIDTQKLVKDLLGWSLEEWYGYVYLAQQTSHTLIEGTRSDRQRYLSGLFNMSPLDDIENHYRKKAGDLADSVKEIEKKQTEITVLENMLTVSRFNNIFAADIEREIEDLMFRIDDTNFTVTELEKEQKKYDDLVQARTDYERIVAGGEWRDEATIQSELEQLISQQTELRTVQAQHDQMKQKTDQVAIRLGRLMVASYPEDYEAVMASPDISAEGIEAALNARLQLKRTFIETKKPEPVRSDSDQIMQYPDIDLLRTDAEIKQIKLRKPAPDFPKPEEEDLDELRMALSNATANRTLLHEKRAQYMIEGTCPTCGSELDEQHRIQKQADVDQALHAVEEELKTLPPMLSRLTVQRDQWVAYEKLGPDRTAELPALEESVTRYKQKLLCRESIEMNARWIKQEEKIQQIAEIPALEEQLRVYRLKTSYRTLAAQMQERDLLKVQYDGMLNELAEVEERLAKIPEANPYKIQELKAEVERGRAGAIARQKYEMLAAQEVADCSDQIMAQRAAVQELQTSLGKIQAQLKELNELNRRIQELTAETAGQEEILREKSKCERLCKEYGKAGKIRQLHLSRMTNFLRDALTCHTYQQLPQHRLSFDVGDGIEINTSKDGCPPYDVSFMSGGEKGALSGAFLFALDDMQSPDRRTSLKIIDELEAAFDKERKQSFIDYMLPELRNRAETVIVISHTPVEDQIFDRTWEIRDGKMYDISGEVREYEIEGEAPKPPEASKGKPSVDRPATRSSRRKAGPENHPAP